MLLVTYFLQVGATPLWFPPYPRNVVKYEPINGLIQWRVRVLLVQSPSQSPSEHCCIGDQTFNTGDWGGGGIPDPNLNSRNLSFFYFLALVNNKILQLFMYKFGMTQVFISLGWVLRMELSNHVADPCLTSEDLPDCFPEWWHYLPSPLWGLQFPLPPQRLWFTVSGGVSWPLPVLLVYSSLIISDPEHLSTCFLSSLDLSFGAMSTQLLWPFLNWVVCFLWTFCCWVLRIL